MEYSGYCDFPASGLRWRVDAALTNIGTNGYNWTSSSAGASSVNGTNLDTNSTWINPLNNNNRGNAFPIRCVQEFAMANRNQ